MSNEPKEFTVAESSGRYGRAFRRRVVPPLENGAHLSAREFMRRYNAMPEVKKAELIQGVVYMASPVRAKYHGKQDNRLQRWLGYFATFNPKVEVYSNSTVRLNSDDIPQPDIVLCLLPEHGGKSHIDDKGYLVGPPELVVEITASTASLDLKAKLDTYRRAGIPEYISWRTEDGEEGIDWRHLEDDEYRLLQPDADGITRSRVFPGLWLDAKALLAGDMPRVMQVLQDGIKSVNPERS